jgi:hypothetical protein
VNKYPLESLQRLRCQEVEEQKAELARRLRDVSAAEEQREARQTTLEGTRARFLAEQQAEVAKGQTAALSVGDFQQWQHFASAARSEEAELRRQLRSAEDKLTQAACAKEAAQEVLVQGKADAKLLETHREKFEGQLRQQLLATEEEDASEVWGASKLQ